MQETMTPAAAGTEDRETVRIRTRVHQKAEFYRHLVSFVAVGAILAAVDLLTSPGTLWFFWPMGAWAIGLVLHAADVWFIGEGAGMEERMLRHELRRHGPRG
jgi:hypothetical protein